MKNIDIDKLHHSIKSTTNINSTILKTLVFNLLLMWVAYEFEDVGSFVVVGWMVISGLVLAMLWVQLNKLEKEAAFLSRGASRIPIEHIITTNGVFRYDDITYKLGGLYLVLSVGWSYMGFPLIVVIYFTSLFLVYKSNELWVKALTAYTKNSIKMDRNFNIKKDKG